MGDIIPFDQATKTDLVALQAAFGADTSMVVSGGFPALSIKGKTWAIMRSGERELITKPNTDDEPAYSLELCIIAYNENLSKIFYAHSYEEGSVDKPDCYSNDGKKPAADAQEPQAKNCATCPHNQWGSRVTDSGKKAKACSDARRVAVASPTRLDDPMLLRVPATSLKPLGEYQKELARRNMGIEALVTKVAFDPESASPLLTFKPVGLITGEMAQEIIAMKKDEVVLQIIGKVEEAALTEDALPVYKPTEAEGAEADVEEPAPAPKAVKKAPKKQDKKPANKSAEPEPVADTMDEDDDDLFAALGSVLDS